MLVPLFHCQVALHSCDEKHFFDCANSVARWDPQGLGSEGVSSHRTNGAKLAGPTVKRNPTSQAGYGSV